MIGPLEKMLTAKDAEERLVAALVLIPLGKGEEAVPVLLKAADSQDRAMHAADALPWLLWNQRLEVFQQLRSSPNGKTSLSSLIEKMAEVHDRRAGEVLWGTAGRPGLDPGGRRRATGRACAEFTWGRNTIRCRARRPADRQALVEGGPLPRATSGGELQRLVALSLLARHRPGQGPGGRGQNGRR